MNDKMKNRIDQLQDQFKEQTEKLLQNSTFDGEYFTIINRLKGIKTEMDVLKIIYKQDSKQDPFKIDYSENSLKVQRMKVQETKSKMDFVSHMEGDKISIRRAVDEMINYRTDIIKRHIKEVYGVEADLDSLKFNIKTGQYGL